MSCEHKIIIIKYIFTEHGKCNPKDVKLKISYLFYQIYLIHLII